MIKTGENPIYLNSFLEYCIAYQHKSTASAEQYNSDLNSFLRYMKYHFHMTNEEDFSKIIISDLTTDDLEKITQDDIHQYISYLAINRRCNAATCARRISTIRIFFKYLTITTKTIKNNPAQNLETPKLNKRLPKYLTLEDSKKLLDEASSDENNSNKERDLAIITLFLNCGLRLSELVSINISDIRFDECKMTVIGKGNKERTIYLNKSCMDAINGYLAVRPTNAKKDSKNSDKALFLSKQRQRISKRMVETIVANSLNKAGLDASKYSTHKLRHTAATLMYQYGQVDIRALQELLGHQSISTTEIYTHVNNNQVREAVESNPLADYLEKHKVQTKLNNVTNNDNTAQL